MLGLLRYLCHPKMLIPVHVLAVIIDFVDLKDIVFSIAIKILMIKTGVARFAESHITFRKIILLCCLVAVCLFISITMSATSFSITILIL